MATKKGFFDTPWAERSTPERVLLIGGGIVGTIFVIRKINQIIGGVKSGITQAQQTQEIQTFANVGQQASYPDSQYINFADALYSAMDGWGTDEEAVQQVFQAMNNDIDVLKLTKAFGTRDGYSLSVWIGDDFDAEDKDTYINSILRRKDIKYQF